MRGEVQESERENCTKGQGRRSAGMWSHGALSKENAAERNKLETYVGAECDAQIMVRAAGEIDFVAGVEAKTDRSETAFETGTRVENAGKII